MNLDFEDFQKIEPLEPPDALNEAVLARVHQDLNPSFWFVFSKLSMIHFFTAFLTLSVCPQFGWRIWGSGPGLMGVFMSMGHYACTMACGFFFLASSLFMASLLLNAEELRKIRRHRFFGLTGLAVLSLSGFFMINSAIVFGFAAAWLFGSIIGGVTSLELGWILRTLRLGGEWRARL